MRAKTLLALGLSGVASAPSTAAASSSVMKVAPFKVAIAMIVIGAAAVPAWLYFHRQAPSAPVTLAPAPSAARVLAAPSAVAEPSPVGPAAGRACPGRSGPPQPSSTASSASSARPEPRPASTPPLAAELAALDAARTSLSHSDTQRAAHVALDGYSRNFPRGKLRLEAEVLRIGALAKSRTNRRGAEACSGILAASPRIALLASRVRSYAGL